MSEHYQEITQDELERLEQYRRLYEVTNPYPKEHKPKFWKELGFEAGALIASAVSSIALSAIRTSTIFMLTEALLIAAFDKNEIIPAALTSTFPVASMIASLLAFEGMLSAHGFIKGKSSKNVDVAPTALYLCFGVTIAAGLSASFGLLGLGTENIIFQLVSWVLAVLTAIGAPVVAYYGSLNLGVILNKWSELKNATKEAFLEDVRSWNNSFLSSFSGRRSQKLYGKRTGQGTNSIKNVQETTHKERSQRTNTGNETGERIREILNAHFSGNGHEIIGTSEIAKILAGEKNGDMDNIAGYENFKGYVHKVRKEWLEENNLA